MGQTSCCCPKASAFCSSNLHLEALAAGSGSSCILHAQDNASQAAAYRCEAYGPCLWRALWTRPSGWGPTTLELGQPS